LKFLAKLETKRYIPEAGEAAKVIKLKRKGGWESARKPDLLLSNHVRRFKDQCGIK